MCEICNERFDSVTLHIIMHAHSLSRPNHFLGALGLLADGQLPLSCPSSSGHDGYLTEDIAHAGLRDKRTCCSVN